MSLPTISPVNARELVRRGARLIDIRGADEFARSHAQGAENHPLDTLGPVTGEAPEARYGVDTKRIALRGGAGSAAPASCQRLRNRPVSFCSRKTSSRSDTSSVWEMM